MHTIKVVEIDHVKNRSLNIILNWSDEGLNYDSFMTKEEAIKILEKEDTVE